MNIQQTEVHQGFNHSIEDRMSLENKPSKR